MDEHVVAYVALLAILAVATLGVVLGTVAANLMGLP